MEKNERLQKALRGEPTDRVPMALGATSRPRMTRLKGLWPGRSASYAVGTSTWSRSCSATVSGPLNGAASSRPMIAGGGSTRSPTTRSRALPIGWR